LSFAACPFSGVAVLSFKDRSGLIQLPALLYRTAKNNEKRFYDNALLLIVKRGENRMSETIQKKVEAALAEIKPQIQADGGDIDLVAIENKTVKVRLRGACAGCPMSALTLKQGVERLIKARVPEIQSVEAVQ
jgi:Fe-S cluster biogenesis protein NfuA